MLREISIRVYKNEPRPSFQFYSGGVEDMYLRNINKIGLDSIQIVNLYFTNQQFSIVKIHGSNMDVNVPFSFIEFEEKEDDFSKKLMILSSVHSAFLQLSNIFNWDAEKFEGSYLKCIRENLQYNWYYQGKIFKSPNSKYHFGLWHTVEIGKYEIWEVLFDKDKKEVNRRLCFEDNVNTFFVSYASWENQNDYFFYSFNGPKKKFIAKVSEIIDNIPIKQTVGSSAYFKSKT